MNHIVNGDVVGQKIKDLDGDIIVWREMYDFGPFNLTWSLEETYKNRAIFFEEKLGIPSEFFIKNCHDQYNLLNELSRLEEIVLWFEHDRYDQLMLIYLLTELSTLGFKKIAMVSINKYPGIEPFHGLGQLTSDQLIELLKYKKEITNEQIQEAKSAWEAYQSNEPDEINHFIVNTKQYLPFLRQSFITHKQYIPTIENGLNEVEKLSLTFVDEGINSFAELFNKVTKLRVNDGLSDLYFSAILSELTVGKNPLLKVDSPLPNYLNPMPKAKLELTKSGKEVLKGRLNRIDLLGIDWWLGGIHLKKEIIN